MSSSPLLPQLPLEADPEHSIAFTRRRVSRFLTSKTAHYFILLLVSLDVACLFGDIVISLLTCGHRTKPYDDALTALEYISLSFSCLFLLELIASVWAFGSSFLRSKFHCFDATIIISSFIFEVALQGVTEEVFSLIVILRLLRVVKIVDEFSVGAEEQMKELEDQIEKLEEDNAELRDEVRRMKTQRQGSDEQDMVYTGV